MVRPGLYRSHRLRYCVEFKARYDDPFDRLNAAIRWLQHSSQTLRGAYTIWGLSGEDAEDGTPIAETYSFRFSNPDTAFAFKMRWG